MDKFEIDTADLPQEFQTMAATIGAEKTIQLMQRFAGQTLYFPRKKGVRRAIKKFIINNYSRGNADAIAQAVGVSRGTVFNYLNQQLDP